MIGLPLALLAAAAGSAQMTEQHGPAPLITMQDGTATPSPPISPPSTTTPLAPQDWSELPVLRFRRPAPATPDATVFVAGEVVAGRCARAVRTSTGWQLTIDLALFATADGRIRRVTPRAIDCPTVEQYTAGLILGAARDNIDLRGAERDTWYRTTMTFGWKA